ncbi:MAG TPA: adenylate/guanylate cyclase domain-containing protein, partial [Bradyrhizobium sp.]|nr:adenylate/guanylate cyclase domain-containing protein [Bradyrhizobium sp.]
MAGAPNPSSAKETPVNCPSCGFANIRLARFCGGCGKELKAITSASDAERRRLCVLFCDLVGSTPLSLRLDAEDLRNVMGSYQRVCETVVFRHDGFVANYRGDGVEVYFGYPLAHEDDATRAVLCALEMLEAVRQLAYATKVDLQVRIGIDSGRVVVGTLGSIGRFERVAIGETPNIAARVQAEAAPGQVVVSDSLRRLLRGSFVIEPMGARQLKGVERPVELFRVIASGGQAAGPSAKGTVFIGRANELNALETMWSNIKLGAARFIILRGEPGIGKSRLVEEFRCQVAGPDIDVLEMRCTPYSQHSAFLPVTELVARRIGIDRSLDTDAQLDRIDKRLTDLGISAPDAAPLMAALLSIPTGERYPPLMITPIRRRLRTLEILVSALETISLRHRTILIVEDLHWADPSTLELLQLIMSSAPRISLLGILTARPEFQPTWPNAPLSSAATNGISVIDLPRLNKTEVEAIVFGVAHGKSMPGEVIRELTQRCEGVPLFVEEVTRTVMESGIIEEREFSWELTGPLPATLIPASVDALLMARIDRLGDARVTAQLAATIGREFAYPLLRAVSERSEKALRDDLRCIVDAGLAWQTSKGNTKTYVFKHVLVQAAAYESLLRTTRQRHHDAIARALLSDFKIDVEHQPEVIA